MSALVRTLCLAAAASGALPGCYVLPTHPYGHPAYPGHPHAVPVPPLPTGGPPANATDAVLQVRLYPVNERAAQSGLLAGTVTLAAQGKGRFQLNYRGETLSGEATRVDGDTRRGIAGAFGPSGTYLRCEYQMRSARQGAGMCTFSDGAQYQVHIGA